MSIGVITGLGGDGSRGDALKERVLSWIEATRPFELEQERAGQVTYFFGVTG
jgi:hypothetical protein